MIYADVLPENPTHHAPDFTSRILIPGALSGGAFALIDHVLAPGALGSPPHTHSREDEWSYVLEGTLTVDFGGRATPAQTVRALPGQTVFKPRNEPHTFLNLGSVPVHFLELIAPAPFETYFERLAPLLPEHMPPDMAGVMALTAEYGLTMHLEEMPRLTQQYGLSLPSLPERP